MQRGRTIVPHDLASSANARMEPKPAYTCAHAHIYMQMLPRIHVCIYIQMHTNMHTQTTFSKEVAAVKMLVWHAGCHFPDPRPQFQSSQFYAAPHCWLCFLLALGNWPLP